MFSLRFYFHRMLSRDHGFKALQVLQFERTMAGALQGLDQIINQDIVMSSENTISAEHKFRRKLARKSDVISDENGR